MQESYSSMQFIKMREISLRVRREVFLGLLIAILTDSSPFIMMMFAETIIEQSLVQQKRRV